MSGDYERVISRDFVPGGFGFRRVLSFWGVALPGPWPRGLGDVLDRTPDPKRGPQDPTATPVGS
jgi:hypothetical protein